MRSSIERVVYELLGDSPSKEFIAHMLGSDRSEVTIAAGVLKRAGLIDYHRGTIRVRERGY
ncbi:MAG: winged helix-turn-helix domain-containing protein [Acidobacteria bacterium]|nr:winged helix-turn-helix domain-containing protein [Acidobacteriota bacterium]